MTASMPKVPSQVHQIRPLDDIRWRDFVVSHPLSSVFHTTAWLESLRRTFQYEPIAFTTSAPGSKLDNAIVFCRVDSWITGRRLVSLPFSDHCDPLVDDGSDGDIILSSLQRELAENRLRYAEIRATRAMNTFRDRSDSILTYCTHRIDLRSDVDTLFRRCHKNSTQRKIRRAEREGLIYKEGRTDALLDQFYRLLLLTRRRHNAPPLPRRWFQNLVDCFGSALQIRMALKDNRPIAAILTLQHKDTLMFKYGCSDAGLHRLGGMQFLFWNTILEAKSTGLRTFDLGRSEWGHKGLITFKDHTGATHSELPYFRLTATRRSLPNVRPAGASWRGRLPKTLLPFVSDSAFCSAGEFLCRHFA